MFLFNMKGAIMPIRLVELHPIIVHFPIALLTISVILDGIALFVRRWNLVYAATWTLFFGVVGALAAGFSGQISESNTNTSSVSAILSLHKTLGFATGFVFALLLLIRLIVLAPHILEAYRAQIPLAGKIGDTLYAIFPRVRSKTLPVSLIVAYFIGSIIGLVLLTLTGYYGGLMVYEHGVGTQAMIHMARLLPL